MASLTEARVRLRHLLCLPRGWDYGQGDPLSRPAHVLAERVLGLLASLGATCFDVAPGSEDGAVIVGYRGRKSAEVHCMTNGFFDLDLEEGDDAESFERLSYDELMCALEKYGWQSPRFYASCTRSVIYLASDAIAASPLRIRAVGASQLSAPRALPRVVPAPANTLPSSTTPTLAVTHQSSGEFQSVPFLMEPA